MNTCTFSRSAPNGAPPNIKLGALVVLKDDNLPPLQLTMGRIVEVFPGKDDTVRVVNVKTSSGTYLRSIHKLCPLPTATDLEYH